MATRGVGLAGVIVGPLLALAAAAGLEAATVLGLGLLAGGICGALLVPAEAVDRRARLAPIYPGAALVARGLAGLALVAVDWLALQAAGRRSRSACWSRERRRSPISRAERSARGSLRGAFRRDGAAQKPS